MIPYPAHVNNYSRGRNGRKPELIVIHLMAGSMGGTASWFGNPESGVSAHYGVSEAGAVHQYVSEFDTAYHAGDWDVNQTSVGIEHEGMHPLEGFWSPTPEQFRASAELAAKICKRWGITPSRETIIPHSQVSARKPLCPGGGFDLEAYVAVVEELLEQPLEIPVRLFDPVSNTQVGSGTAIRDTDKVYVKSIGPLRAASEEPATATPASQAAAVGEDGEVMAKIFSGFYQSTWVNGGVLGKLVFGVVIAFLAILLILAFSSLGRAQEVDILQPATWFTSTTTVIAVVGILMGWLTKLATALGKDWFNTSGNGTVIVSAIMAVIIGGIGGYQALGMFGEGGGGIQGAVQAVFVVLIAFFGSNASAKADRQAIAGGAARLELQDEAAAKARLQ